MWTNNELHSYILGFFCLCFSVLTLHHCKLEIIRTVSKRLYFLVQLKWARLTCSDFFLCTSIRLILACAVRVSFYALPKYLQFELDWIKKRSLSIILP